MEMEKIVNQKVKISPRSITVKSDAGKTIGVVTHAIRFCNLPENRKSDYFRTIRQSGIWDSRVGDMDCVYEVGGKLYYLFDLRLTEFYEKYIIGHDDPDGFFENARKNYDERKKIAEKAQEYLTVIPCYVIK